MKKMLEYANIYAKQNTWKDFALVKFCLCAIGIIIGVLLPDSVCTHALIIAGVVFLITYIPLMVRFIRTIIKINKEYRAEAGVQYTLLDEISDMKNDTDSVDDSDGYITYYNLDGTFHSKEMLNKENVGEVIGAMVRCTMNNGDTYEGFSSPFRKYGANESKEENYDILYLWTWDNLDEETHQLIGDEESKYNTTYTPVLIDEIKSIDVILFSGPRWGGGLYNHFFIDIKTEK